PLAVGGLVDGPDVGQDFRVLAGRRPGVGLEQLDQQREHLPAASAGVGLEQGVAGGGALLGVGAVVDAAQPLELPGVGRGQGGGVGDDQGVVGDQAGGVGQEPVGQGAHVPVLAGEVAAEALLGGVGVAGAVREGAGDFGEVDVAGDDQAGDHVGEEAAAAGV